MAHFGGAAGKAVLSHYISTSGTSGFDNILKTTIVHAGTQSAVELRQTWPTFLTVPDREDAFSARLQGAHGGGAAEESVPALLHVYDAHGLPAVVPVEVRVTVDYYAGTSDGFAGYGTMCPKDQPPASPSTCFA